MFETMLIILHNLTVLLGKIDIFVHQFHEKIVIYEKDYDDFNCC